MKLRAPGFAQVHKAAESGISNTSLIDVPPAEVRWAIPWQVGHPCAAHLRQSVQAPWFTTSLLAACHTCSVSMHQLYTVYQEPY